ncbi:MAG: lipopolysaccharide kinase InaA family protein [Planctomycetota bacterium]|jgi:hypothetical protein
MSRGHGFEPIAGKTCFMARNRSISQANEGIPRQDLPIDSMKFGQSEWLIADPVLNAWLEQNEEAVFTPGQLQDSREVKLGDRRGVWCLTHPAGNFFLKVVGNRRGWLSRWRRNAAVSEWWLIYEAARRGAAVIDPVALGRSHRHNRAVLVTRGWDGAVPLTDLVGELGMHKPANVNGMYIKSLARFLADTHARGLEHPDGHPGNILARFERDGSLILRWADLAGLRFRAGQATVDARIAGLSHLEQYFRFSFTRSCRLRFLQHYMRACEPGLALPSGRNLRTLAGEVELTRQVHAERLARHRDRRMLRDGKYFGIVSHPSGWRGQFVLKVERRHRFPEEDTPDMTREEWHEVLERLATDFDSIESPALEGLVAERSGAGGVAEAFRWYWRGSPSRQAFIQCHQRRHRDHHEPLILGFAERARWGLCWESVVFTVR